MSDENSVRDTSGASSGDMVGCGCSARRGEDHYSYCPKRATASAPSYEVWISFDAQETARGIFHTELACLEDAATYGQSWVVRGPFVRRSASVQPSQAQEQRSVSDVAVLIGKALDEGYEEGKRDGLRTGSGSLTRVQDAWKRGESEGYHKAVTDAAEAIERAHAEGYDEGKLAGRATGLFPAVRVVDLAWGGPGNGPYKLFIGDWGVAQWPGQHDPREYAEATASAIRKALARPCARPAGVTEESETAQRAVDEMMREAATPNASPAKVTIEGAALLAAKAVRAWASYLDGAGYHDTTVQTVRNVGLWLTSAEGQEAMASDPRGLPKEKAVHSSGAVPSDELRAQAWLDTWQPDPEGPNLAGRLAALLADVRRETVEACAKVVEQLPSMGLREVAARLRSDLFTRVAPGDASKEKT